MEIKKKNTAPGKKTLRRKFAIKHRIYPQEIYNVSV